MFSFRANVEKALEADAELSAALTGKLLSTQERTDEVNAYPHGRLFITMLVDALHKSEELPAIEIQLIHICQFFKNRATHGEHADAEFTQLLTVMQKIYKSYSLTAQACNVIFGDLAVDRKLGELSDILDLLMPLTKERLAAVMTHAKTLVQHYECYRLWQSRFESLPTLTTLKECAFANFLEIYTTLCDAFIIQDKHRDQLINRHDYLAAMWILEKCGVTSLRRDNMFVTPSRIELSEKIARLLMSNQDMCEVICKYAVTQSQGETKINDEGIDSMSQDLINMLFSSIPELKNNMTKAFQQFVFDRGSALVNSLRDSQTRRRTK